MSTMSVEQAAIARLRLESVTDVKAVLGIPNSDYQLHLVPNVPASQLQPYVGKRVKGVIEARALRMHPADGGGIFIEPVIGTPRIVQGRAIAVDQAGNRLLMHLGVPVWVTLHAGQTASDVALDRLLNFYVESGATFTPVTEEGASR